MKERSDVLGKRQLDVVVRRSTEEERSTRKRERKREREKGGRMRHCVMSGKWKRKNHREQ